MPHKSGFFIGDGYIRIDLQSVSCWPLLRSNLRRCKASPCHWACLRFTPCILPLKSAHQSDRLKVNPYITTLSTPCHGNIGLESTINTPYSIAHSPLNDEIQTFILFHTQHPFSFCSEKICMAFTINSSSFG